METHQTEPPTLEEFIASKEPKQDNILKKFWRRTLSGKRIDYKAVEEQRYHSRSMAHQSIDVTELRKRRAKNKVARKSRQINRKKH